MLNVPITHLRLHMAGVELVSAKRYYSAMDKKYEAAAPGDPRDAESKEREGMLEAARKAAELAASIKDISIEDIEAELSKPGLSSEAQEQLEMLKRLK
jgi:hypothetical protein